MTQIESCHALQDDINEGTLLHLLSNHLILCHTTPYLPVTDVLRLAATSRAFRALIYGTSQVFRHLDLTHVKAAQFEIDAIDHGGETWRNVQLDENVTEDDFYSGPLRGIFSSLARFHLLRQVQTLVLDGLSVTAELVHDILIDPSYNIRVLSLRDAKHLNERILRGALQTACRPTRPSGTPNLKALYIFGTRADDASAEDGIERGDAWYTRRGKMLTRTIASDWAHTLVACRGIIAFDAVLCNGPKHYNSPVFGKVPVLPGGSHFAVATHSVGGCEGCGSAPEGWTVWGERADDEDGGELGKYPLLSPPPLLSSQVRVGICPSGQNVNPSRYGSGQGKGGPARFIARCTECLRDRYCYSCQRWWCEACYRGRVNMASLHQDHNLKVRSDGNCFDCGLDAGGDDGSAA